MFDHKENAREAARTGKLQTRGARNEAIIAHIDEGRGYTDVAEEVGLSPSWVRKIYLGKTDYKRAVDPRISTKKLDGYIDSLE